MKNLTALGNFVKNERLKRNLSIRRLSEKTNVSYSYLAKLEKGTLPSNIKPSTLESIASGLKINSDRLYKLSGLLDDNDPVDLKQVIEHNQTLTFDGHQLDDTDIELIKRILAK